MELTRINFNELNSRQKEAYNFQKVSAVLADFGFCTIRLSDDWNGADFIAQHKDGEFLPIQLKSRVTFEKKYEGKNLWLCCPAENGWYLYPHDLVFEKVTEKKTRLKLSGSWRKDGGYNFPPPIGKELSEILAPYRVE